MFGCTSGPEAEEQEPVSHVITIEQMKFTPAALMVNAGDSVTWINNDIVDHNVTEEANSLWTSGSLKSGEQWSTVVNGSAAYLCTLHPVMKGSLTVRE